MRNVAGVNCDRRVGREHVESLSGLQRRAGRIQSAAYVARRSGATVGAVFLRSLMNGSHGAKGAAIADARWKALAFGMPKSMLRASVIHSQVSLAANEICIGGETRIAEPVCRRAKSTGESRKRLSHRLAGYADRSRSARHSGHRRQASDWHGLDWRRKGKTPKTPRSSPGPRGNASVSSQGAARRFLAKKTRDEFLFATIGAAKL
jgi:hypothetical protein